MQENEENCKKKHFLFCYIKKNAYLCTGKWVNTQLCVLQHIFIN